MSRVRSPTAPLLVVRGSASVPSEPEFEAVRDGAQAADRSYVLISAQCSEVPVRNTSSSLMVLATNWLLIRHHLRILFTPRRPAPWGSGPTSVDSTLCGGFNHAFNHNQVEQAFTLSDRNVWFVLPTARE
eukprot:350068-Chlamydomonas_euryale.AAC.1